MHVTRLCDVRFNTGVARYCTNTAPLKEQISGDVLELNQGTLYPALLRLQQMGWIASKWGASDNNRRARFYAITRAGKKQLATEAENWERVSDILARFARPTRELS